MSENEKKKAKTFVLEFMRYCEYILLATIIAFIVYKHSNLPKEQTTIRDYPMSGPYQRNLDNQGEVVK